MLSKPAPAPCCACNLSHSLPAWPYPAEVPLQAGARGRSLTSLHRNPVLATAAMTMRTPEDVFEDFSSRRQGILSALCSDVERFIAACDPERENLCLYVRLAACCLLLSSPRPGPAAAGPALVDQPHPWDLAPVVRYLLPWRRATRTAAGRWTCRPRRCRPRCLSRR